MSRSATCLVDRWQHLQASAFLPSVYVRTMFFQDDQRILWEGVSSLTKQELQVSSSELS